MASNEIMRRLEDEEIRRDNNLISEQKLIRNHNLKKDKLHIVYIMAWTKTCGGSKIILEYANRLAQRGHLITLVAYDEKPNWFRLDKKINFIKVNESEKIENHIPDSDLIIATSWKCIYSGLKANKAPVVFFEQGGSHIFNVESLSKEKRKTVEDRIKKVPFIYTVSEYTRNQIMKVYHRDSEVMYNAVDENIFFTDNNKKEDRDNISITLIGSEEFKFKNVDVILEAVRILGEKYSNIQLNWISQTKPKKNIEKAIINPPQIEIGNILRKTDIYICNSEYESFGLPTLEAMTCGAAVITSDTGGMRDFVIDGKNALIIKKNDVNDIVNKVEILIENPIYRSRIIKEGINTSKRFNWKNSIDAMEKYFRKLSQYEVCK